LDALHCISVSGDYLVLHLSELVRMAFIAATSDSDKLRLAGLAALQVTYWGITARQCFSLPDFCILYCLLQAVFKCATAMPLECPMSHDSL
jgi:hypothetical protein